MTPRAVVTSAGSPCEGFDLNAFSLRHGGVTKIALKRGSRLYSQEEPTDDMFYVEHGQIQLSVTSALGRDAIIAILGVGDFCGENCLIDEPFRETTAACMSDSTVARMTRGNVVRALAKDPKFAELCVTYFLNRSARLTERLISQHFDSGELRLARILLQLSRHGSTRGPAVVRDLDQEALAQMIGTSRSRVNHFMTKFRNLGYIHYDGYSHIVVYNARLQAVRREAPRPTIATCDDRTDFRSD